MKYDVVFREINFTKFLSLLILQMKRIDLELQKKNTIEMLNDPKNWV